MTDFFDGPTDHTAQSVTIGRIYVCSTARQSKSMDGVVELGDGMNVCRKEHRTIFQSHSLCVSRTKCSTLTSDTTAVALSCVSRRFVQSKHHSSYNIVEMLSEDKSRQTVQDITVLAYAVSAFF